MFGELAVTFERAFDEAAPPGAITLVHAVELAEERERGRAVFLGERQGTLKAWRRVAGKDRFVLELDVTVDDPLRCHDLDECAARRKLPPVGRDHHVMPETADTEI